MTDGPDRPDLRMVALGAAAWAGGLATVLAPPWWVVALLAAALAAVGGWSLRTRTSRAEGSWRWTVIACLLVGGAVAAGVAVRAEANATGPVARLADERAVVSLVGRVDSDPVTREGRYGDFVVVRLTLLRVSGRGYDFHVRSPVLVLADPTWASLRLGATVAAVGRLEPPDDDGSVAGVLAGTPGPGPSRLPPTCSVAPRRCVGASGSRCAAAPKRGPWCRPWSWVTTVRCPLRSSTTSGPPD